MPISINKHQWLHTAICMLQTKPNHLPRHPTGACVPQTCLETHPLSRASTPASSPTPHTTPAQPLRKLHKPIYNQGAGNIYKLLPLLTISDPFLAISDHRSHPCLHRAPLLKRVCRRSEGNSCGLACHCTCASKRDMDQLHHLVIP